MTLEELMRKVEKVDREEKVPTGNMLRESDSPIEASDKAENDVEVSVFRNGYVIYRRGEHETVFPLERCGDYTYLDAYDNEYRIPYSEFINQPWQVRVLMEGEKRLFHNANSRRSNNQVLSYDVYVEGWKFLSDREEMNPLERMIREEMEKEEDDRLRDALSMLSERQRFILIQCVVFKRPHKDIAEEIGVTRVNVGRSLRRILNKIRNYYGIGQMEYGSNCFSRKRK